MAAITDDEIEMVEFAYRQRLALVGSDREISESLIARIRADAAKIAERDAEIAKLRSIISARDEIIANGRAADRDHNYARAMQSNRIREITDENAKLRAVAEAARVLNATLNVTEGGLYKMVDVADDVGCSNLGGTSYEEHPDVEGAMERMTAALAALDDKGATNG